jgi:hypothetical protein
MTPPALRVYVGYDAREQEAWRVCAASLARRTTVPITVHTLDDRELRTRGLFWRPWRPEGRVMIDEIDGRPFSTAFAFTRFLVPTLCRMDGFAGWALFIDSDMLWTADIGELLPLLDPGRALMCVQHQQTVAADGGVKMDGQLQQAYPRKNWSSFMAFNLADRAHDALTAATVNSETGRWLHGLSWLEDAQIGALPETWNWLEGYSPVPADGAPPKVVHYTRGGPWFAGYETVTFADLWRAEARVLAGE